MNPRMSAAPDDQEGVALDPEMPQSDIESAAEDFAEQLGEEPDPARAEKTAAEAAKSERDAILGSLGSYLQRQAEERVNTRRPIEDRWIEDLRQYHSQYDPDLLVKIKEQKGSEVFVNITAPKTDGFAARMADMILPSDAKNWGIKPTPVPAVLDALQSDQPIMHNGQQITTASGEPVRAGDVAQGIQASLEDRCRAMEREMDDQLTECGYNGVQRRGIDQCAQLGTMALKGPCVVGRTRKMWRRIEDATGVAHVLEIVDDERPAAEHVDIWDFFPDMSCPDPEGWEDVFQRHYMTKRQLRELAKQPGFDADSIRAVLNEDKKPMVTAMHLTRLRDISGEYAALNLDSRFELWEYHGPVTAEQLAACGCDVGSEQDPLDVMDAVVWFCEGRVLKAVKNPYDGLGYHATWVRKDETSPFGFGIPRLMRNSQKVANAAWRMVMDNSGLALAPQIIMALGVQPADGNWTLYPGKIWIAKEGFVDVSKAMQTFDLPVRLKELLTIFETAMKLADEETAMPVIMQGEHTPAVPETAEGMAMLFNAASVVQRRFVRLYDDRITKPVISGFYDWNMAYNPKEDIKGDYSVVALGSSALLEKERHAQNVLAGLQLAESPNIMPHVKFHGLVAEAYKALRLGEHVRDEKDAEAEIQKQAQAMQQAEARKGGAAPQGDQYAQQKLALAEREVAARENATAVNKEIHAERMALETTKLSQTTGLGKDKIMAALATAKLKEDGANSRFNAEAQIKADDGSGL